MRISQIPQTSSRKGFVRLAHDMKKKSSNPSDVTRSKIWLAGHTHADGRPVRPEFQDTIDQIKSIDSEVASTAGNNIREDAVSKVLGKDKPGRVRGLGRGVTATKLAFLQAKDAQVKNLEAEQADLRRQFQDFRNAVKNQLATGIKIDDASRAASREVNQDTAEGTWCQLLDWYSSEDVVVGEGEFCSVDPVYKIGGIAIGPNAAAIYLKSATVAVASLWRPTSDAGNVGEAVGTKIPWPPQKIKVYKESSDNNATSSSTGNESMDKIYIYGWNLVDTIVAEGRMVSTDPEEIVNNSPIGPNAAVVMVEMVIEKNACLWRPSTGLRVIGDVLHQRIVWPLDKVDPIITPSIRSSHVSTNSNNTSSTQSGQKKKCYLMDCSNPGLKVAEGKVWSSNPTDTVHHTPLGPNASKVSVDVPLIGNTKVWKPTSVIQTIDDALGSLVAWPSDKLVFM